MSVLMVIVEHKGKFYESNKEEVTKAEENIIIETLEKQNELGIKSFTLKTSNGVSIFPAEVLRNSIIHIKITNNNE